MLRLVVGWRTQAAMAEEQARDRLRDAEWRVVFLEQAATVRWWDSGERCWKLRRRFRREASIEVHEARDELRRLRNEARRRAHAELDAEAAQRHRERCRAYHEAHKQQSREQAKAWREANAEKVRALDRERAARERASGVRAERQRRLRSTPEGRAKKNADQRAYRAKCAALVAERGQGSAVRRSGVG